MTHTEKNRGRLDVDRMNGAMAGLLRFFSQFFAVWARGSHSAKTARPGLSAIELLDGRMVIVPAVREPPFYSKPSMAPSDPSAREDRAGF